VKIKHVNLRHLIDAVINQKYMAHAVSGLESCDVIAEANPRKEHKYGNRDLLVVQPATIFLKFLLS